MIPHGFPRHPLVLFLKQSSRAFVGGGALLWGPLCPQYFLRHPLLLFFKAIFPRLCGGEKKGGALWLGGVACLASVVPMMTRLPLAPASSGLRPCGVFRYPHSRGCRGGKIALWGFTGGPVSGKLWGIKGAPHSFPRHPLLPFKKQSSRALRGGEGGALLWGPLCPQYFLRHPLLLF